jgi:hypothetical protein
MIKILTMISMELQKKKKKKKKKKKEKVNNHTFILYKDKLEFARKVNKSSLNK